MLLIHANYNFQNYIYLSIDFNVYSKIFYLIKTIIN